MNILVRPEPMGRGFQALIADNPGYWGRGDSISEAVGDLVRTHATALDIDITYTGDCQQQLDRIWKDRSRRT